MSTLLKLLFALSILLNVFTIVVSEKWKTSYYELVMENVELINKCINNRK